MHAREYCARGVISPTASRVLHGRGMRTLLPFALCDICALSFVYHLVHLSVYTRFIATNATTAAKERPFISEILPAASIQLPKEFDVRDISLYRYITLAIKYK